MLSYPDGTQMLVGDSVLVEYGRTLGTIVEIIEETAEVRRWQLEGPGVMIKSPTFGMVLITTASFSDDPIEFVGRAKT
jgi:hypothetical protein